ncbi:50S ribosomal protein L3 [Candidatus Wolfebacteria bacterium]|nr:MAG: 50S ribosomal protein L3 [Candidatus Wolfebacteria bacterium]
MKFILGQKQNMTQYFDEDGNAIPVTLISAGPVVVTQVKTIEKDGYSAIQVGYQNQKKERVNKPQLGHFKGKGPFKFLNEFSITDKDDLKVGDSVDVSVFEQGDKIRVSGISKGKGFQGVVKRHGFHGGPRSHGQKHSEREPGSIGATGPQRVFKGTRMAGRMGSDRTTVKNLKVVFVDKENNTMLIKGALPGRRGTLLEIRG